jgi:hypothetical protein
MSRDRGLRARYRVHTLTGFGIGGGNCSGETVDAVVESNRGNTSRSKISGSTTVCQINVGGVALTSARFCGARAPGKCVKCAG